MLWLLWLILAVLFVIFELFTGTFFMLVLAASAFISMITALFHLSFLIQLGVFTVCAFLIYVFLLPIVRKLIPSSNEILPSPNQLIGQKAFVISDIRPGEGGLVKVNSDLWSAFADELIQAGEEAIVIDVKVTKLYVKKGQV
ncbi:MULTISPECIES: NfeD family protein [Paenibacillus]|uniref:NfeD family protein n=1 Tax=Paenibacillus violae TaxID=3077234 RepID=A0ABU3RCN5_9BACL|nr:MULTISPECIES: NfeD family protein [Paenibacillus]MDU0202024.1 NfeD family protein [Paenibacillus sp. PFR10]MEC0266782.1 NfeD family protein [Paenibacillus anseongense]